MFHGTLINTSNSDVEIIYTLLLELLALLLSLLPACPDVRADLGRNDDCSLTDTSDDDVIPATPDMPASADTDDADTVGAVTVMLTRESRSDPVALWEVAVVVVAGRALKVASSWRAFPSS